MKKIVVMWAMLLLPFSTFAGEGYVRVYKTQGEFDMVRDALQMAIEGKGLVINHTNHIAEMLDRTGKDLGATKQVYSAGEQFEFCSAALSRRMMEADPQAMVVCPYSIAVYTRPDDKNVYLAYRKPPETRNAALKKAFAEIEKLLDEIIRDAM